MASLPAYGQGPQPPENYWLDDSRPVSSALRILQERCRCVITYEDPQYERSQVADITAKVSKDPKRREGILGIVARPFGFTYEPPAVIRGPEDMVPAVTALLESFHLSGNTSKFRLRSADGVLHVVPVGGSVLNVRISLPKTEASGLDMLGMFVTAVNNASETSIGLGAVMINHMVQSIVTLEATNEPARQVLARLLRETGRKITWHLYYDYGMKGYALNLAFADPGGQCLKERPDGQCIEVDLGDHRRR